MREYDFLAPIFSFSRTTEELLLWELLDDQWTSHLCLSMPLRLAALATRAWTCSLRTSSLYQAFTGNLYKILDSPHSPTRFLLVCDWGFLFLQHLEGKCLLGAIQLSMTERNRVYCHGYLALLPNSGKLPCFAFFRPPAAMNILTLGLICPLPLAMCGKSSALFSQDYGLWKGGGGDLRLCPPVPPPHIMWIRDA